MRDINKYKHEKIISITVTMKVRPSLVTWLKKNNLNKKVIFVEACKKLGWKE